MKRRKPIARTGRVKAVNPARRAAEFKRAYGSPARVTFVASLPCCACGYGPSENAHIETGGMGRKADADTICPLCASCHRALHRIGRESFERQAQVDLAACASTTERMWRAKTEGNANAV